VKILLVGANGQVGREIQDLCTREGIAIEAFTREQLDITNLEEIENTLAPYVSKDIYIVNAAAYTAVDKAEDDVEQCYKVNRDAVANLATFAKQHHIPSIHISTDYVFAGDKEGAYSETDTPEPTGIYGASKLAGEIALQEILPQHIILRVSWVFGQYGKNFVKTILRLAGEQEKLRIVADQHGNPTGAAHIAEVILKIIQALEKVDYAKRSAANDGSVWGIYHYCDFPSTTWFNFAQTIIETAQSIKYLKVKEIQAILTPEFPTKAKRPMNSRLNCDKIERVFGISQFAWQDELVTVIKKC
jgi:dTDP-4-dehydrorhamnose reductase